MDDLISRQTLLNDIEELKQSPWFNDDNYFAIRKDALSCVVDLCIKKAPSVDAVEVVRCRDCKYFELNHWDGIIITAHEICNKWADGCKTNKDGYCFLGERKINDS